MRVVERDAAVAGAEAAERDAAIARAEAAEAELRAIREEVRAAPAAKTVDAVAALFASARCSVTEARREAERLRHGVPIEGDLVCPNDLRATTAEAELARLRPLVEAAQNYVAVLVLISDPEEAGRASAEMSRVAYKTFADEVRRG